MKKGITGFWIIMAVLMLLVSCTKKEKASSDSGGPQYQKLKVGMMPFGGNVPAQYAYDQGWFKDAGLDVEFMMFANGAGINEALAAKQVDMGVSGLAMVFSLASGTCTWVAETNTSSGMGIYVRPDSPILTKKGLIPGKPDMYGSVDTIKGIKVLGQLGTSSQYNVICYVQQFGLTEKDIEMVHIDLGTDLQAFIAGEGDALAASRPFSFQAEARGYVCAGSFEDATGITLNDGIVVRNDVLAKRRDEIVLFLREYFKALEIIQNDEQLRFDFSKQYFATNGRTYSDEDLRNEMRVQEYITKDFMSGPNYVYGQAMTNIAQFYHEGGKIEAANLPNVTKSFDASLIKDVFGLDLKVAK
jgi:ABC-type nitrate/sulfonate/bicarbonate transport system substrate-binding protein